MTFNQLTEAVAHLGFEGGGMDPATLLAAACRAVEMIYSDRASVGRLCFDVYKPTLCLLRRELRHSAGGSESFPLQGRSYVFRVSGKGEYTLTDGGATVKRGFDGGQTVKGRLKEGGSICFMGENPYTVRGFACYMEDFSGEEIPEPRRYRDHVLSNKVPDFAAFVSGAEDERGQAIAGSSLRDGIVSLPFDFSGCVVIRYKRRAPTIFAEDADKEIDVPPDTVAMLPLATAAYAWLDDDPEKAQYYMSLYRELMADTRRYSSRAAGEKYQTNGWA